jgi:ribonuclease HII
MIWALQVRWLLYEVLPSLYLRVIDSKTLSSHTRASLLETLSGDATNIGWSVRVLRLVASQPVCVQSQLDG